jgi:hypothetical protein
MNTLIFLYVTSIYTYSVTKHSSVFYPMILNKHGSKEDILEMFAKEIGTDFVKLEFSKMRGNWYQF